MVACAPSLHEQRLRLNTKQQSGGDRSDVASNFGQRLRQLREGIGLSVKEFAAKIGFSENYVYKLESGAADNPSLQFTEAVVNKFGVDREWFLGGVGDGSLLKIKVLPYRCGVDGYIGMRLECLLLLIETYTDEDLDVAMEMFSSLAISDKKYGKLFGELANIIALERHMKRPKVIAAAKGNETSPPPSPLSTREHSFLHELIGRMESTLRRSRGERRRKRLEFWKSSLRKFLGE